MDVQLFIVRRGDEIGQAALHFRARDDDADVVFLRGGDKIDRIVLGEVGFGLGQAFAVALIEVVDGVALIGFAIGAGGFAVNPESTVGVADTFGQVLARPPGAEDDGDAGILGGQAALDLLGEGGDVLGFEMLGGAAPGKAHAAGILGRMGGRLRLCDGSRQKRQGQGRGRERRAHQ